MTSPPKDSSKEITSEVDNMIADHDYKGAATLIIDKKLQQFYTVDKVLVPLYLQQRYGLIFEYLKDHPGLQKEYTQFLDENLQANKYLLQISRDIGLANVSQQQIIHHNIKKHLSKVLNKFGIPISSCPNLLLNRKISALNFFINKKYKEHSITEESWKEMVEMICNSNPAIPLILVKQIVKRNDLHSALEWAKAYNVPHKDWPHKLKEYQYKNIAQRPFTIPSENQDYLNLKLSKSSIILVETPRQLLNALELIKPSSILGIDEEWQPSLGITDEEPPLALIQLATRSRVFILDMVYLKNSLSTAHWQKLAEIFTNPNILKLTYHFENGDLSQLKKCSPVLASMGEPASVLDLKDFYEQLQYFYPGLAKEEATFPNQVGLSRLTAAVLGLPLDKKEQKSDWEKRPLRASLLSYAALDAYCLIQIYDALMKRANQLNLDFDFIVDQALSGELRLPVGSSAGVGGVEGYY